MERRTIYGGQIPSTLDLLLAEQYSVVAMAQMAQDILQNTTDPGLITHPTLVAGFTPSYPGGMSVSLEAGRSYTLATVDATAQSDLPADTRQFLLQGQADALTLAVGAAPATVGQSRIDIIQVTVAATDDILTVLPYFNSADPATPFNGAANNGIAQSTRRWLKGTVTVKAGTASATPVAPSADAGNIALFTVTVAYGATALTGANLAVHATAPFIGGLSKQHHTGAPGSAPKINLVTETTGVLPAAQHAIALAGALGAVKGFTGLTIDAAGALSLTLANLLAVLTYTPLNKAGDTMTAGFLSLFQDPTSAMHAATKQYVDALSSGFTVKTPVRATTTANITLAAPQTIDGVAVIAGERVLVKNQTTGSQNGVYTVAAGAWTRSVDFDTSAEAVSGSSVNVQEGTVNADSTWVLTTNAPITLGTTSLTFSQFSGLGDITVTTSLLKSGNQLDLAIANPSLLGGVKGFANLTIDGAGALSLTKSNVEIVLGVTAAKLQNMPIVIGHNGKPTAAQEVFIMNVVAPFTIPLNGTGSIGLVRTNPTAAATYTMKKNGVSFGTINVSTGGVVTFTIASATSFIATDIMTVEAPATVDATLATMSTTILASIT